ncbi:uncharacterized protein DFL_003160 [Arthrobotrys flagrans]|uniref:Methyltransferase domain-containing protein n=1 Tax=Arthrobotrys flagrans TaxID=97331 RepID=A0A437A0N4_ARTFL|nr:hypothetical protein DFL_003160 [Arthrobotrys flagrans]
MATTGTEKFSLLSVVFDEMAKNYENGIGGAQKDIVRALLSHSKENYPINSTSIIHDNACGPAVATSEILNQGITPPPQIFATDYAQGMIDITNSYKERRAWDTVTVQQMDGQALSFEDEKFTHSISSLGVFLFPDEKKGLSEMYRTLKPGGWIGVSSWKDVRWPTAAIAAYEKLFPDAKEPMILPVPKNWMDPENCERNLLQAGFREVKSEIIHCINRQENKEIGASAFAGFLRQVSPTVKAWDEETREEYMAYYSKLVEDMFSPSADGSGVELTLYAIVTSGRK